MPSGGAKAGGGTQEKALELKTLEGNSVKRYSHKCDLEKSERRKK